MMYTLILWSIPMGLIAAVDPRMATGIAGGMSAYLRGIPEELYALFGTATSATPRRGRGGRSRASKTKPGRARAQPGAEPSRRGGVGQAMSLPTHPRSTPRRCAPRPVR
jgi:hypothetical protein